MSESGQTEEERRVLRHKQRKLNEGLHQDGNLRELHHQNNELFEDVQFTREAVLDADNHLALSAQYVKLADKMVQVGAKCATSETMFGFEAPSCNMLVYVYRWGALTVVSPFSTLVFFAIDA